MEIRIWGMLTKKQVEELRELILTSPRLTFFLDQEKTETEINIRRTINEGDEKSKRAFVLAISRLPHKIQRHQVGNILFDLVGSITKRRSECLVLSVNALDTGIVC